MQVNLTHFLGGIQSIDLRSGTLESISALLINWFDEFLVWDPNEYGGIVSIAVADDKPWVPEITQTNSPSNNEGKLHSMTFKPMWLRHDGLVTQYLAGIIETRCTVDTRPFPFDEHVCTFQYFCVKFGAMEVSLVPVMNQIDMSLYRDNTEWEATQTNVSLISYKVRNLAASGIGTELFLTRRPTLEIIGTFVPGLSLGILNLAACFIPPDSGERLSFSVTAYLAFIFYVSAVQLDLPRDAINISVLSYCLLAIGMTSTISVVWSVFIVRLSTCSSETHTIPTCLRSCLSQKRQSSHKGAVHPNDTNADDVIDFNKNEPSVDTPLSWLQVTYFLDKIFFAFMFVGAVIICLYYFARIQSQ